MLRRIELEEIVHLREVMKHFNDRSEQFELLFLAVWNRTVQGSVLPASVGSGQFRDGRRLRTLGRLLRHEAFKPLTDKLFFLFVPDSFA